MVVIRLKRMGKKKAPFYRVVVADSRNARDGKVIDELGYYSPAVSNKDKVIDNARIDAEKYKKWISFGACPSRAVEMISKRLNLG